MCVTEISELPAAERARRYSELAREARIHAANSKGEEQISFIKLAGQWTHLAREANAEAQWEK